MLLIAPFAELPFRLFRVWQSLWAIEDFCNLFQTVPSSLWEDEVGNREEDDEEDAEDDVVFPANVFQPDRITKSCDNKGAVYGQQLTGESL